MRTPRPDLSPEQLLEAERIFLAMRQATEDEQWQIAQLLASKPDDQIFGATEYQVRDLTHKIGAKAIEAALVGRKRGLPRVQPELPGLPRVGPVRRLPPQVPPQPARDGPPGT